MAAPKKSSPSIPRTPAKTPRKRPAKAGADALPAAHNELGFHVVGIGASAGGFEALEAFFNHMPADSGMAFVVVQHLSPDYKSLMVELLSKHTAMPVRQVENDMPLAPDTVFLLPPKKNMTVLHGRLHLVDKAPKQTLSFPIDIFLNSLAEDQGEMAIAVILSGTGSDGTRGIRTVKEHGGLVMVQDLESAKFDGMPRNAIATDLVDYVTPPQDMPAELTRYARHPYARRRPDGETRRLRDEDRLASVFAALKGQTGVDFTYYKQNTVLRRIERRMRVAQIERVEEYLAYLYANPAEVHTLYKELLIGVTRFFRDAEPFALLADKVLPEIFAAKAPGEPVRIWTAGCSTGEEAYSLAILCKEYQERVKARTEVKIFATDVDRDALEYASAGRYPENIAADLTEERLKRFFLRKGDRCEVAKELREMVIFAQHNLVKDPPFNKIDLVACRNMLIYLQPVLQQKVLLNFNFALNENGVLFLGSSETIGNLTNLFGTINGKWKFYRCRGRQAPVYLDGPTLPAPSRRRPASPAGIAGADVGRVDSRTMFDIAYAALFKDYLPPSVVVNRKNQLVHAFGNVSPYVMIQPGAVSLDMGTLLRRDLVAAFDTGVHKALRSKEPAEYRGVRLGGEGEDGMERRVNLRIVPYADLRGENDLVLVAFEPVADGTAPCPPAPGEAGPADDAHSRQRIADLEGELQYTRENLQATIEELEATNEELQATNEELLSANEELQSTNEELQSVNEELITVNAEYQGKIEELTTLNNDVTNLLASTSIGTVFLDTDLKVRKFTPAVREAMNLMSADIGRPISHIALDADYAGLVDDARTVLTTLVPVEREVRTRAGRWLLVRLQPYRTEDNAIRGVVLTFVDITRLKEANRALHKLTVAVEKAPASICIAGPDLAVEYVNRAFTELTGLDGEAAQSRTLKDLVFPAPPERKARVWKELAAGRAWSGVCEGTRPDGAAYLEEVTLAPIRDEAGTLIHYLKLGRDVTRDRQAREALHAEQELRERIVESSPVGITLLDLAGKIIFANPQAQAILGVTRKQAQARTYNDPAWRITAQDGSPLPPGELPFARALATGKPVFDVQHAVEGKAGRRMLSVNASPVRGAEGKVMAVVCSFTDITDRLAAEDELCQHRERLDALFAQRASQMAGVKQHLDALHVLFLGLDREGRVTLVNRRGCEVLGKEETDILGRDWFAGFVPAPDRAKARDAFARIMAGQAGPEVLATSRVLDGSGGRPRVDWHAKLLYAADGRIAGLLSSGTLQE